MRRTREATVALYTWLTPAAFGEQIGTGEEHVRGLITDGWFRKGEVINVARNPEKRREFRIAKAALQRFLDERSVA